MGNDRVTQVFQLSTQERAMLKWLREMDSSHVTTGLLALAFEAGWNAHEQQVTEGDKHEYVAPYGRRDDEGLEIT